LVVIAAREITGSGVIEAQGGDGSLEGNVRGGAGGGGVVWVAARQYRGNVFPRAPAGFGHGAQAENGEVRFFRIGPNRSLEQAHPRAHWEPGEPVERPALPYSDAALEGTDAFSDRTLRDAQIDSSLHTPAHPLTARTLTIDGTVTYAPDGPPAVFLRASTIRLQDGSVVHADGMDGADGMADEGDGAGGHGAGGGGHGRLQCFSDTGGASGGGAGEDGSATAQNRFQHRNGFGWGRHYDTGFDFGTGGDGGSDRSGIGRGGAGGRTGGGGGSGGRDECNEGAGGGGGGGGLVVLVADRVEGAGTLRARGGDGGPAGDGSGQYAGAGGGGGIVWVAARSYDGQLEVDAQAGQGVNAGTAGEARIFQIRSDGTLEERGFGEAF
jgi:hypothetical protein